MPVPPYSWPAGVPVTAHQLNNDLYAFDEPGSPAAANPPPVTFAATGFNATGIRFHTHRPAVLETLKTSGDYIRCAAAGAASNLGGWKGTGSGYSVLDNSALFGLGADNPGNRANFTTSFVASTLNGSAGRAGTAGGWCLMWHFTPMGQQNATSPGGSAAVWYKNGKIASYGSMQAGDGAARDTCPFILDLGNVGWNTWSPGVICGSSTATSFVSRANTANTAGETGRLGGLWVAVSYDGAPVTGTTTAPAPPAVWTAASTASSSALNTGIRDPLRFLNYPPALTVAQALTAAVPASTQVTVPFTSPALDTYSGFSGSSHTWTAPVDGVYLIHANLIFTGNDTTRNRAAGLTVTPANGPAVTIWGGNYQANPAPYMGTGTPITRVLDLHAGDSVQVFAWSTTSTKLGTYNSRLLAVWLAALPAASPLTYTPPDTTYRWQAGTPASQLPALFTQHIGNDLNFLISKPYVTAYQAAPVPLVNDGWAAVTMDTVAGLIHGSTGDNYGGWSAALTATVNGKQASGLHGYTAPVPGWYLVVAEISAATPATGTGCLVAGISCPSSGGVTQPLDGTGTQVDWYQHAGQVPTTGGPPAATAIGLYWLDAGESVIPMAMVQDWPSNALTTSVAAYNSTFSVIWACS